MELKSDFIEKVTNCNWFANCGDQNFNKFEVILLKEKKDVAESIQSHKWENICLAKEGEFSSSIVVNHIEQYHMMGEERQKIKKEVIKLSKRFTEGLKKKEIRFDGIVLEDVLFNVQTLFMVNDYSEYTIKPIYFLNKCLKSICQGICPVGGPADRKMESL